MPRVLVKLDASGERKSFPVTFDQSISVSELIPLVYKASGLKAEDYTIDSISVFIQQSNGYVEVNQNVMVENLQKLEINITKKDYSQTKVLILSDNGTQETLFLNNADIDSIDRLTAKIIEKLSLTDAEIVFRKIEVYEEEFEEYIDLPNPPFFERNKSYKYTFNCLSKSNSNGTKNIESSVHSKPVSCGFQDGPTELSFTKEEVITRQALGRIAALGELYDAHKDAFCSHSLFCNNVDKYITPTDTQKTDVEEIFEDSINAKFKKFEVEAELKASFLSGMISVSGNGKYLSSSITNTKESSASLVCRMLTKHQKLNISNRTLLSDLSLDAIKNTPSATHVVTAIQWGAGATAELLYKHQDNESKDQIKASLKFVFKKIAWSVEGSGEGEYNDNASDSFESFRLKFYVDALPNGENIPQTIEEARNFMKQLPKLIEKANDGKGVPLVYILTPLCSFKSYLKEMEFYDRMIHKVDESIIEEIVQVFDEISKSYKKLDNIYTEFTEFNYCLKDEILQSIAKKLNALKRAQTNLRKELYQTLVEVRYGKKNTNALSDILQKYQNSDLMPTNVNTFCYTLISCMEKIAYAKSLLQKNVIYVGKDTSLEVERIKHDLKEYFGYFCDWTDERNRAENFDLFVDLGDKDMKLLFIDMEVNPGIKNNINIPDGNRICHYLNRKYIDTDYLQSWENDRSKCFAKCSTQRQFVDAKPIKLTEITLPCPQSFNGRYCSKDEYKWLCYICRDILKYDYENNFYCQCGLAPISTFEFHCSHDRHGGDYICFRKLQLQASLKKFQPPKAIIAAPKEIAQTTKEYIQNFQPPKEVIQPRKEINILLLGENGVGKSMIISRMANFFANSSLSEAQESPLICPMPVEINYDFVKKNMLDNSESCPVDFQKPSTHVFNIQEKIIRIIDTPCIGDINNVVAEKEIFESIFERLSTYKELHGICIFWDSYTPYSCYSKYRLNEIFLRFHKNALQNILFCIAYDTYPFHRPDEVMEALNRDIKEQLKINLPLRKSNIFSFDKGNFKYLCMLQNNLSTTLPESKSWEHFKEESYRLGNHIQNNVKPHLVEETLAINEARRIISSYSNGPYYNVTNYATFLKNSKTTEIIVKCVAYLKANALLVNNDTYDIQYLIKEIEKSSNTQDRLLKKNQLQQFEEECFRFRQITSKNYENQVVTTSEIKNLRKEYDRIKAGF